MRLSPYAFVSSRRSQYASHASYLFMAVVLMQNANDHFLVWTPTLQVIPLHLPPGDTSTERNVYINGMKEQIESAKELINEVISGVSHRVPVLPSMFL